MTKSKQYEHFKKSARELGLDNEESAASFERAMGKIVPPKKRGEDCIKPAPRPSKTEQQ